MVVVASERSRVSPRAVIILPFAGADALIPTPSSRRPYPGALADALADAAPVGFELGHLDCANASPQRGRDQRQPQRHPNPHYG